MKRAARTATWSGFRSVLCPVDFSEPSRLALRFADVVARRNGGVLSVVYVNDPFLIAAAAAALHDRTIAKRSAKELSAFVDETLASDAARSRRARVVVSTGRPAAEILEIASTRGSDLIVAGTHGLTGADRLLVGSTTLGLLQRSNVPVLAVPLSKKHPVTSVPPLWPGKPVMAAVELDDETSKDVDVAARIAEWFDRSLLLLHMVAEIRAPQWMREELDAHERICLAQAQQQLEALAAAVRRVPTEARVVCGRVADEVAAAAARARAQLVITSLRDRHTWFGAQRGSISYHVLTHAVTPVLACPPTWRPR